MEIPAPPAWYVISLRPQGAHEALRRAARRHGAALLALSPWRIQANDDAATREALRAALDARLVLFTSPAAVAAAKHLLPLRALDGQAWLAVGAGTADALRRAGIAEVLAPRRMDSEGLLALPALHDVAGQPVGFVTAPDGRNLLAPTLHARGAVLQRAEVYRREPVPFSAQALRRLERLDRPACLLLSSGGALEHALARLPPPLLEVLRGSTVVAASERLAEAAGQSGFARVVHAAGPRPAQLLRTAVAAMDAHIR